MFGRFDRRASCDYYPISVLSTNGATNGGLKVFLGLYLFVPISAYNYFYMIEIALLYLPQN